MSPTEAATKARNQKIELPAPADANSPREASPTAAIAASQPTTKRAGARRPSIVKVVRPSGRGAGVIAGGVSTSGDAGSAASGAASEGGPSGSEGPVNPRRAGPMRRGGAPGRTLGGARS